MTITRAIPIALTALSLTATAAAARGAEDPDAARAAGRFQQGVELYREGSYEGALAEFRKAYQLSPSYRVLYNIAQTQYALHDFVGAHKSLLQYITEGGGEIGTDRRAQVDEMSARLAERIGHLQISASVPGADIRVDDVSVGLSPLPGPVPVNVGTRRISAIKSGAPAAVRVVTVAGRETLKVELVLDESAVAARAPARNASTSAATATANASPAVRETPTAATLKSAPAPSKPSRSGLIVSMSTTAVLAVATGICGYLALGAQKDLEDQVGTYPNTRDKIEDARTKSRNYGYLTDALGAATIVSGGIALYFALTQGHGPAASDARAKSSLVLAPTVGGMVVQGRF